MNRNEYILKLKSLKSMLRTALQESNSWSAKDITELWKLDVLTKEGAQHFQKLIADGNESFKKELDKIAVNFVNTYNAKQAEIQKLPYPVAVPKLTKLLEKSAAQFKILSKSKAINAEKVFKNAETARKMKIGYISIGVVLILISLLFMYLFYKSTHFQEISQALKNYDWKRVIAVLKLTLIYGALMFPAVLGVCLIIPFVYDVKSDVLNLIIEDLNTFTFPIATTIIKGVLKLFNQI